MSDAEHFVADLVAAMEADLGQPLGTGTVVVPAVGRGGSGSAVGYPLPGRFAIWCDPAVADTVRPLAGDHVLDLEDFLARAESLGGQVVGRGRNLTLEGDLRTPEPVEGYEWRILSRDNDEHVAMMRTFADALSEDDLEESELDVDDLDPRLSAVIDPTGGVVAFASALPADDLPAFDDIGVAVHPDHRRRNLGALAVASFVDAFCVRGDRRALYRHDVDNIGSARLSESLGFTPVHTIAAVMWAVRE